MSFMTNVVDSKMALSADRRRTDTATPGTPQSAAKKRPEAATETRSLRPREVNSFETTCSGPCREICEIRWRRERDKP
jgi:hypothetical protein